MKIFLRIVFLSLAVLLPTTGYAQTPGSDTTASNAETAAKETSTPEEEWWEEWDKTPEPGDEATPPQEEIKKEKKIPVVKPLKKIPPAAKK